MTIPELEDFFKAIILPETLIVNTGETIIDVKFFIESHFRIIKNQPDGKASQPFYDRLLKVKELLANG